MRILSKNTSTINLWVANDIVSRVRSKRAKAYGRLSCQSSELVEVLLTFLPCVYLYNARVNCNCFYDLNREIFWDEHAFMCRLCTYMNVAKSSEIGIMMMFSTNTARAAFFSSSSPVKIMCGSYSLIIKKNYPNKNNLAIFSFLELWHSEFAAEISERNFIQISKLPNWNTSWSFMHTMISIKRVQKTKLNSAAFDFMLWVFWKRILLFGVFGGYFPRKIWENFKLSANSFCLLQPVSAIKPRSGTNKFPLHDE